MTTVHAHRVVHGGLALLRPLISRVGEPAVGLQQDGGAEVFFRIPPVRGARGRAAEAEDTFVEAVELLALRGRLPVFEALWSGSVIMPVYELHCDVCERTYVWRLGVLLKVWLDRLVLFIQLGQVWYEVFDDVGMW